MTEFICTEITKKKNKCVSKTQTRHMGVLTRGGGLLVKLITLRLTVFERFAVKWPKFSPKISDLGIQSSSAFDKTGIIAIPLKSSHVMVLVRQSFGFGIGTM